VLVTDGDFGFDGCFYITDWVNGWNKPGKGRIYRIYDPAIKSNPVIAETKELFATGFSHRSPAELAGLLAHPDMRVRQEAQFALVEKGAIPTLALVARKNENLASRLNGVWGLGQLARNSSKAVDALITLLEDRDPEIRGQAAKVLGDARVKKASDSIAKLLSDDGDRSRFFAAIALGRIGDSDAVAPVLAVLKANDNRDAHLRHAGVMALVGCAKPQQLTKLAKDSSSGVRMAALLALRRLQRAEVAAFLGDADPAVALEAVRAINDLPIEGALADLAKLGNADALGRAVDQQRKRAPAAAKGTALVDTSVDNVTALLRRVVNANYRLGKAEHAQRLSEIALNSQAPESVRGEALTALATWAEPSGRDQVTGLWRPLERRDPKIAAAALEPKLKQLLGGTAASIKIAAIKAASALGITSGSASALEIVSDTKQPANVRVEALKALASAKDSHVAEAVTIALKDSNESLRREGTRIQAQLRPEDALAQLKTTLETGSVSEKQSAFATLGSVSNSPASDELLLEWMDRLLAKQVPPELHVDLVDAAAKRARPPFEERIRKFENSRPPDDDLRAYRECLTGGNADDGKKIIVEKAEVYCIRCHKAGGDGGEVGPDLKGIASRRTREYILESIVYPNKHFAEGYESLVVTLKNGTTYAGTVKSESTAELELNSPEDGLVKIKKAEIQTRERGLSGMPEEIRQVLSKHELRDVVEFLSTLK
jgi:quinoprotein glucose dehydrogenase